MPEPTRSLISVPPTDADRLAVPVGQDDHVIGPEDASVTLVEYGDFQCPYCAQAHRGLKALRRSGDIRIVWRHFPITEVHPRAEAAARAAEAAGRQARFWEMHDLLFSNLRKLGDTDLVEHAQALGLDLDRFRADLEDPATLERVNADVRDGLKSGVRGTPMFFRDGQLERRPWPSVLAALPRRRASG